MLGKISSWAGRRVVFRDPLYINIQPDEKPAVFDLSLGCALVVLP